METVPFVYKFCVADYYVIGAYLLLLCSVGFLVKRLCRNSKDYLIGGNKIPWWLCGGSIFMMSFSAWTFTGAAGFAYDYGVLIIAIFYFNVIAFLLGGRFLAHRVRQTRLYTFGQIIYERFGRAGEQFFVWIQIPKMLFGGAIWLLGLAVFVAVAFGIPMPLTILVTGGVILLYTTLSGSWAVMTSDFLQTIILLALTVTISILTLLKVGGFGGLVEGMDPGHLRLFSEKHSWMWVVAYFAQIMIIFNSVIGANRFLAVRDGKDARKAAYLAAGLFLLGPVIWFIPPLAASFLFPDIGTLLPALKHPSDGAYVLMGLHVLPAGLAGLLVMAIFAATLSSLDSAINANAGILAMNVYKPLFRPGASDREMFLASRVFNVLCGVTVIASAYALSKQEGMNLFDLMLLLSAGISLPLAVPCVLLFFFRKTPKWTAVAAVAFGGIYSVIGLRSEWDLFTRVMGILAIGIVTFSVSRLFWNRCSAGTHAAVNAFYTKMETPVSEEEVTGSENVSHLLLVGSILMMVAAGLFIAAFFPNPLSGRLIIGAVSFSILVIGGLLYRIGGRSAAG